MKKLASIFFAGICLVMLTVAVATALGAEADSVAGGEARRTYGVNEERLAQKAAEREAQPSVLVSYIKANLAEDSLLHKVYFALYMLMPFAILAISLWMEFTGGWGDERKLFMLGLSEFIFGVGNAGMGAGVYPWFCDFDIVGWIVTIVCFCYMFRLLMKQAGLLMGFVNRRSDGMFLKKVLYYVIYFAIAASVTMLLAAKTYFWTAPVVLAAVWYYFYKFEYGDGATAARVMLVTGVIFGGFIIFFMQVLGLIIIVALTLFLLSGFASIKTSPVADESGGSIEGGMVERSADGTPFVRNRDGSVTQLRDRGDGTLEDFNGRTFRENSSGHIF